MILPTTTVIIALLLHHTPFTFAAPANDLPSLAVNKENHLYPQTQLKTNGTTGEITYPVDNSPITLLLTPIPNQKILRADLVMALYDSREYLKLHVKKKGDGRLQGNDNPFSSARIPNPPAGKCVVEAKNAGPPAKELSYRFLGDAVQGLMDYTFFPYTAEVDSLTFEVSHNIWGVLGSGSVKATTVQDEGSVVTAR